MLTSGDKVLVCSNISTGHIREIAEKVQEYGLSPIVYEGVRSETRESSLDRELRDDFYSANLRIVYFAESGGSSFGDHWAALELEIIPKDRLLVYVCSQVSPGDPALLALPVSPIHIAGIDDLLRDLNERLRQLTQAN